MKSKDKEEEDLDKLFFDKLNLLKDDSNVDSEAMDKIKEYQKINDEFREMNVRPVKFKTLDERKNCQKKKSYIVSNKYFKKAKEEIERLCRDGIIIEAEVKYVSPAFFKKKLDLRLVIDYGNLNKYIIDEFYDIPKIYESFMSSGSRFLLQLV